MKIHLVRHAQAVKRVRWKGPDELRPLSVGGRRQAVGLVAGLGRERIARLVSSPSLRCRKTLEPLAAARGLRVELDARLGEGEPVAKLVELLESLGDAPAVLCTHGSLVSAALGELEARGLEIRDRLRSEKGSVWVIEGSNRAGLRATYRPPTPKRASREGRTRENEESGSLRLAVLDMGSTSFHLLVADATAEGGIRRVARERVMLRLGALVDRGGAVPEEVCARVVRTAGRLRKAARDHGAEALIAVATASLREPANGWELAERVGVAVGTPVRVLSGEEEARLIFAAFRHRGDLVPGLNLGLDLGGGSLELALGDEHEVRWETTLRMGAALLHREMATSDPLRKPQARAVRDRVRKLVAPHVARVRASRPSGCTASGGSVRALARLTPRGRRSAPDQDLGRICLPLGELSELRQKLVGSSHQERLSMPGIQRQRADLLPTAALILETVLQELGLETVTVSGWGLREGVVLEVLGLASSARSPDAGIAQA